MWRTGDGHLDCQELETSVKNQLNIMSEWDIIS